MNFWSENLIFFREEKGETQSECALALGISRSTYANYEAGVNMPNIETVEKIIGHFGINFEIFLSNEVASVRHDKKYGQQKIIEIARNSVRNKVRNKPKDARSWWAYLQAEEYNNAIAPFYDMGDDNPELIRYLIKNYQKFKHLAFLNLPGLGDGIHFRIEVTTDNMAPIIHPNDNLVITYLPEPASTLLEGSIYVTIDKNDIVSCNRLFKLKDGNYKFMSESDKHKPFNRSLKDISAVFKLREIHTRHFDTSN
jgi:transcriptional regulator with XRE-family HTH domain